MKFVADFETTTDPQDCRVWAYGLYQIGNDNFLYGTSIDEFMQTLSNGENYTLYFHNLKFDGEFILNWLFQNGYSHVIQKYPTKSKTFTTLISDKGMFYSIEICFGWSKSGERKFVKIYDSLKILPFKVEEIAKCFDLPISKLEIDYKEKREIGHVLTETEVAYLKNDCQIVAMALDVLFKQGLNKMTQGSNAFYDYKRVIGKKYFEKWFPVPYYDEEVRQSYKGGFTYLNPKYKNRAVGKGIVLDVNSLYPSVMYDCPLPTGEGRYFEGRYKKDKDFPLFIQMLTCNFELKPGYIPTVQLKNNLSFIPTEYLTSSVDAEGLENDITLCLTSPDLKLFLEHYNVKNIEWKGGWKWQASNGLFKGYIDKWYAVKEKASREGNTAMRTLAKLMLNALYGKFALNPNVRSKIPYYADGVVHYKLGEPEKRKPIYIPVGTFITAWARYKTISSAQKVSDRFIYADTDSLHLEGTAIPDCLEVHDTKLGAWKLESTFTRAKFIRQKTYAEEIDGKMHITCAGMPKPCYQHVTWDNFQEGSSFPGKLRPLHVQGGIVLVDENFTIKG